MKFVSYGQSWTPEQKEFLATHYADGDLPMLMQVLNRGKAAIYQQARRQRLVRPQFRGAVSHRGKGRDPIVIKFREERQRLKWTLPFLANRIGVPKACLSQWECGHHQPSIKAVRDWAQALGLEIGIIGVSEIHTPEPKSIRVC
jgi:DNA-binding XRE family transcriptional regulator